MDNKQHCKELLSSISEYIDGSLNEQLCAELESHLNGCDNCRVVVNTLKKTIEIYHDQVSQDTAPQDVKDRLFVKLNLDDYMKK
ncbi:MAG: anti-sigma factor family protein [Anaerolineaceae bacterium]|jgi:anti-sigma factor (TIGR02949 family)|nr:MAG: anti-sigma factor [Chloroflexi bacterium HGW-Chloroflexi-8]